MNRLSLTSDALNIIHYIKYLKLLYTISQVCIRPYMNVSKKSNNIYKTLFIFTCSDYSRCHSPAGEYRYHLPRYLWNKPYLHPRFSGLILVMYLMTIVRASLKRCSILFVYMYWGGWYLWFGKFLQRLPQPYMALNVLFYLIHLCIPSNFKIPHLVPHESYTFTV